MVCVICKHGEARTGVTRVFLHRNDRTVLFKAVPADICESCGEYYLGEEIAEDLYGRAETAMRSGAEVEILRYAA